MCGEWNQHKYFIICKKHISGGIQRIKECSITVWTHRSSSTSIYIFLFILFFIFWAFVSFCNQTSHFFEHDQRCRPKYINKWESRRKRSTFSEMYVAKTIFFFVMNCYCMWQPNCMLSKIFHLNIWYSGVVHTVWMIRIRMKTHLK